MERFPHLKSDALMHMRLAITTLFAIAKDGKQPKQTHERDDEISQVHSSKSILCRYNGQDEGICDVLIWKDLQDTLL